MTLSAARAHFQSNSVLLGHNSCPLASRAAKGSDMYVSVRQVEPDRLLKPDGTLSHLHHPHSDKIRFSYGPAWRVPPSHGPLFSRTLHPSSGTFVGEMSKKFGGREIDATRKRLCFSTLILSLWEKLSLIQEDLLGSLKERIKYFLGLISIDKRQLLYF